MVSVIGVVSSTFLCSHVGLAGGDGMLCVMVFEV